jgi:hypothetical protein
MTPDKKYYKTSKHWLKKFKTSVRLLHQYADNYDALYESKLNFLKSQIEIIKKQIKEYEMRKQELVE